MLPVASTTLNLGAKIWRLRGAIFGAAGGREAYHRHNAALYLPKCGFATISRVIVAAPDYTNAFIETTPLPQLNA